MTEARTGFPRTNWSGNYTYSTDRFFEPATIDDVRDAVRSVPKLKALGTRHCFNGIADSTVAQLSTRLLADFELDPISRTVRIGSGVRYGELAQHLHRAGFALHNMASLPHISVGGAVATATHGSGLGNGNLATAVQAIEVVTADGTPRTFSRQTDPDLFAGTIVHLGALGIATHLTLTVEPAYAMVQTVYEDLPFSTLESNLRDVMSAGYSVSLFTDWEGSRARQVWVKQRADSPKLVGEISGDKFQSAPTFFGATRAATPLHPLTGAPVAACTEQGEEVGPWFERLPHFRLDFTPSFGEELQSEYFVPFDRAFEAVRAVETLRDSITPILLITELRAIAADDLWLSPQFGQPTFALHFTWKPLWDAVLAVLPRIEAVLEPFGARPHWGKVFTVPGRQIRQLYPRMDDFIRLASQLDPGGKFRNEYLDRLLGA